MNGYNFTERVRVSLAYAREEAARLHHEYVGTEHLLLGMVREGQGVAASVLANLDVTPETIRQTVLNVVKTGKAAQPTRPDLPYTSRAKKVLELAMSEARELGQNYVGTEHLLLGLLREEKGIAAQVLVSLAVTLDRARVAVKEILIGDDGTPPSKVLVSGSISTGKGHMYGSISYASANGTTKLLLTISAIPAWLIGVGLIFNAKLFEATIGIAIDDKTVIIAQAQGAILLGLGFINWLARGVTDRNALWAILYGNFVIHAVSFAIVLRALVQDLVPMAGFGALALHVLLGSAFGWQALQLRRAR